MSFCLFQTRDAQRAALVDKVKNMESSEAGNTIYRVLQQRHMQEKVRQEEQFNREIATAKAEARAQAAETCQAEREELIAEQEKVRCPLLLEETCNKNVT